MSTATVPTSRLMRRRTPPTLPVHRASIALLRLGEKCNHECPMCSNAGRESGFHATEELLRRVRFLAQTGMRRVVVTGGEPTIHPGFWEVIAELRRQDMIWDINSNGRAFADRDFAWRAMEEGLQRAILSLHAADAEISRVLSGISEQGHAHIVAGITNLLDAGCEVMVNCVMTTLTIGKLSDMLTFCAKTFGGGVQVKFAFPTTIGRGGDWHGIQLRYSDIQEEIRGLGALGGALGIEVHFESVPPCVLGDTTLGDMSRSGFGETHYLDDARGDCLHPIAHIEAELSAFANTCRGCTALTVCPGVSEAYLRRHGGSEFRPL